MELRHVRIGGIRLVKFQRASKAEHHADSMQGVLTSVGGGGLSSLCLHAEAGGFRRWRSVRTDPSLENTAFFVCFLFVLRRGRQPKTSPNPPDPKRRQASCRGTSCWPAVAAKVRLTKGRTSGSVDSLCHTRWQRTADNLHVARAPCARLGRAGSGTFGGRSARGGL